MMIEQEINLEKMKLVIITPIEKILTDSFAEPPDCTISMHQTFAADQFILRVTQAVWGRITEQQEVRYPANWREAIKQRFAPEWFLHQWPVKETVVVLTARELYPSVAIPDRDPIIDISKYVTMAG